MNLYIIQRKEISFSVTFKEQNLYTHESLASYSIWLQSSHFQYYYGFTICFCPAYCSERISSLLKNESRKQNKINYMLCFSKEKQTELFKQTGLYIILEE